VNPVLRIFQTKLTLAKDDMIVPVLLIFLISTKVVSCFAPLALPSLSLHPDSSRCPKDASTSITNRIEHPATALRLSSPSSSSTTDECAALLPAQVVQIRVGDVSQARKAWKKRRRSGSPLLIPATMVGVDQESAVRHNVMLILHKYGSPVRQQQQQSSGPRLPRNGVALSVSKVCRLCERDLGLSLLKSAQAMGYDGVGDMLLSLFDGPVKNTHGVEIVQGLRDNLLLVSKLSRRHARELASKACLAHVASASAVKSQGTEKGGLAMHLGTVKVRQTQPNSKLSEDAANTSSKAVPPTFLTEPLSAAVRIKQEDVDDNRIQSGEEYNAFVLRYDVKGDNGSPLLTLAMDPPPRPANKRGHRRQQQPRANATAMEAAIEKDLANLKVGEGPFKATVAAVSTRAGAAFVDIGVGRQRSKRLGGGTARVLGMLRFDDLVRNVASPEIDLEESSIMIEDLSPLDFEAEWEEASNMSEQDEMDIDFDDNDEENDDFSGLSPEERLREIGIMMDDEESLPEIVQTSDAVFLQVNDIVEVYIKAVSQQSGRFMVTLDPSVKDKKAKQLKMEKTAQKRMSKLAEKMGGGKGLDAILELVGTEFDGVVKAVSKNDRRCYYVQPLVRRDGTINDELHLPVGIATPSNGAGSTQELLLPGDEVRIKIDGIDEKRGQLAMTLLE